MKRLIALVLGLLLTLLCACGTQPEKPEEPQDKYPEARKLQLSETSATLDGETVEEFDYTWHCDPTSVHDENENAPAEYHTGTKPETDAAVFIDSDLSYYPSLPEEGFTLIDYDGEREWAYYYSDGEHDDYIFATLPMLGNALPTQMMHTEQDAAQNRVLHITEPGTYVLEGKWTGQISVELGEEETDKVTLILNGVEINCTVAPGLVVYSAYECGGEADGNYSVDTSNAGANVIIADGTENSVSGTNIYRMLKPVYKNDEGTVQKKLRKLDGAFYSYVSMNVLGEAENSGTLTVNAGFEGLDSEMHLTVLGGNITVNSQDDGINVNEDNVSVVSFLGGTVTLNAGLGAEGDGVDSNGYVYIDGGTLRINGIVPPDSAIDSEDGIRYQSGTVIIDGVEQSYTPGQTFNETGRTDQPGMPPEGMEGQPGTPPDGMGERPAMPGDFDIKDFKEKVAALGDDATLDDVLALLNMGGGFNGEPEPRPQP